MLSEQQVIRALRRLEKNWTLGLWLFVASGMLWLMRADNEGRQVMLDNGCVDPDRVIEGFHIPSDGGDW